LEGGVNRGLVGDWAALASSCPTEVWHSVADAAVPLPGPSRVCQTAEGSTTMPLL